MNPRQTVKNMVNTRITSYNVCYTKLLRVTAEYYQMVMNKVESRCDLKLYEGAGHGFFNYTNFDFYKATLTEADKFLVSLGYLTDYPQVGIE